MAFKRQQALELLRRAWQNNRLPHALLIVGSQAAGSHALACDIVCELCHTEAQNLQDLQHPLFRHVRPSSRSRSILVDDIRANESFLSLRVQEDEYKIIVITDAECMKEEAANAFLKTLEEPPPRTLIILVTEHPTRLLPTILSRCIRMELREEQNSLHLSEVQQVFFPILMDALEQAGDDITAIALSTDIQRLLQSRKEEITKQYTAQVKEQAKRFSDGTDVRDWESQQKDATLARIETEYLREREELLELITLALGQAVLSASHATTVRPMSPVIEELGRRFSLPKLLLRMQALDELRRDINFNVKDSLAFDVHLLDALGKGN